MKALSVQANYCMLIASGDKVIEWRTWDTPYRGDILFCSTKQKIRRCISGHALCVATLVNVRPFRRADLRDAMMDTMPDPTGFAWELDDVRLLDPPFPVKGKLGFFEVDDSLIHIHPNDETLEESEVFIREKYLPLVWQPVRL